MSFESVVGHERVIRLLKGQLQRAKVASTYLFVGPPGIGKRLLATEFAKALRGDALDASGWSDFKVVEPQSDGVQIGIDQVRELSHWIAMTPSVGSFRIALLDGADEMTEEASHACLKLLEEPPPKGVLLLMTQAPHRLATTFVSRCHVVRCIPQGVDRVASFLQEKEGLGPDVSRMLATLAGGRLGMAVEFHRKDFLRAKNSALTQILTALAQKSVEGPLSASPRLELERILDWLAAWWRDQLLLKLGGRPEWIFHQDCLAQLRGATDSFTQLVERVERTYRVKEAVQQNVSPRIALAALLAEGAIQQKGLW